MRKQRQNSVPPGCSVLPGAWDGAWRSGGRYFLLGDRVHEPAWDDVRLFRNGVLKVGTVKRYIEYLALLGMNDLLLYTEDTYEIPKYPHFGALRGRYTKEEIREMERYAAKFGIELVPCIQTLAHLRTYLRWPVTEKMRDNSDILLVGEPAVYEFLEDMIRSVRTSFQASAFISEG